MDGPIEKKYVFDCWDYVRPKKINQEYFDFLLKAGKEHGQGNKYFYRSEFFLSSPEFIFNLILKAEKPQVRNLALDYLARHTQAVVVWTLEQVNTRPAKESDTKTNSGEKDAPAPSAGKQQRLLGFFLQVLRRIMGDMSGRMREALEALVENTSDELHPLITEQMKCLSIRPGHPKKCGYRVEDIVGNIAHALYIEKTSHP